MALVEGLSLSAAWKVAVGIATGSGITAALGLKLAKNHFTKMNEAENNLSCAERHTKTHDALVKAMQKYEGKLAMLSLSNDEQFEVIRSVDGKLEGAAADMNDQRARVNVNHAAYYMHEPHKYFDILSNVDKYPVSDDELKSIKSFRSGSWQDNQARRLSDKLFSNQKNNNRKILARGTEDAIKKIDVLMNDPRENVAISSYSTLAVKYNVDGQTFIKISAMNEMQSEKMRGIYGADRTDPDAYIRCLIEVNEEQGISKPEVGDDVVPPSYTQAEVSDAVAFPTLVDKGFKIA